MYARGALPVTFFSRPDQQELRAAPLRGKIPASTRPGPGGDESSGQTFEMALARASRTKRNLECIDPQPPSAAQREKKQREKNEKKT
jgi:hypothetical protein